MTTARCFIALDVDEQSVRATERAQRALDGLDVRKAPIGESVHLTIKFFGDVDVETIAQPVFEALRPMVEGKPAPSLGDGKLGAFPTPGRAHVLVLHTGDPSGAMAALAARAEDAAAALGVPREGRAFHPHLTLARSRRGVDVRKLVERTAPFELGTAARLVLYRSDRTDKGAKYTALASAEFRTLKI